MNTLAVLGPWIYPLAAIGLCLFFATIRAVTVIQDVEDAMPAAGGPHHPVIAWGVLGGLVGLLGSVVGLGRVAMGARAATGSEREQLEAMLGVMWDGALVIVAPLTVGVWLFASSIVIWLALQFWIERRLS